MISALGPYCHCSPCTGASLGLSQDTSQRVSPARGPGSVPRREGCAWGRKGQGLLWPPRAADSLAACSKGPDLPHRGSQVDGEDGARPAGLQPHHPGLSSGCPPLSFPGSEDTEPGLYVEMVPEFWPPTSYETFPT